MDQPPVEGTTWPVTLVKRTEDSLDAQRFKFSVAALRIPTSQALGQLQFCVPSPYGYLGSESSFGSIHSLNLEIMSVYFP